MNIDQKAIYIIGALATAGLIYKTLSQDKNEVKKLQKDLESIKNNQKYTQKPNKNVQKVPRHINQYQNKAFRICITGGAQSGKETAVATLQDLLQDQGYNVLIIPKLKREVIKTSIDETLNLAVHRVKMLQDLNEYYEYMASLQTGATIIISEYGILDSSTQLDEQQWAQLIDQGGFVSMSNLRDKPYDIVMHLVTSADGNLEFFYPLEQEKQQDKQLQDEAILKDRHIQRLWTGHPHHIVFDNREQNLTKKIDRVVYHILDLLDCPVNWSQTKFRKLIVETVHFPADFFKVKSTLTDTVLIPSDKKENERLRKRESDGLVQYSHLLTVQQQDGFADIKRYLSSTSYQQNLKRADTRYNQLVRERISFTYDNQSFQLDCIQTRTGQVGILRILEEKDKEFKLPAWIRVTREVTNEIKYESINLAKLA